MDSVSRSGGGRGGGGVDLRGDLGSAGDFGFRSSCDRAVVEDIDGNGVVDIRDALCLARKVDSRAELERRWDINQDGIINRADADSVAMVAVNLSCQGVL
jgi:hypothetical protein